MSKEKMSEGISNPEDEQGQSESVPGPTPEETRQPQRQQPTPEQPPTPPQEPIPPAGKPEGTRQPEISPLTGKQATETPEEVMRNWQKLTEALTGALPPSDLPPKEDIEGQREWVWRRLISITDTGTKFGASENYADALKMSQARPFLEEHVREEVDALTLIYNHFINFANAPGLNEAEQLMGNIRAGHFNTLFHRPELAQAFRLWERYANKENDPTGEGKSILAAEGEDLQTRRNFLLGELNQHLKNVGGYKNPLLASEFSLRFGEFLWRISERAAFLDSKDNSDNNGSGEYYLRRLFHGRDVILRAIRKGLTQAKEEIAQHVNFHIPDWFSSLGEDFWLGEKKEENKDTPLEDERYGGQDDEVKAWYRRMKREGKVDEEGGVKDLSDCPVEKINFLVGSKNPNSGAMVGHVAIGLTGAEKTRSTLMEAGGFLEYPTQENLDKLKGLFGNLTYYTPKSLEEREETAKKNQSRPADVKESVRVYRQEAVRELMSGMREYLQKRRVSSEVFARIVDHAADEGVELIGKKERNELMKETFRLPAWLAIAVRRLDWAGGLLKMILEAIKAGLSTK